MAQQEACEKFEQMSDKGKEGMVNYVIVSSSFFLVKSFKRSILKLKMYLFIPNS